MNDICPKCKKVVYDAEKKIAAGLKWHAMCVKCNQCNKMLNSTNLTEHEEEIFCRQCHWKKYGPKGYGYGGSGSMLSMNSGDHIDNIGINNLKHKSAPVDPIEGGCLRCGRRVYEPEKAIGCPDGLSFHKTCFNCKECKKKLNSVNICTRKGENDVYCKGCYGRNFGTKGVGFGIGAGCLNMG